MKAKAEKIPTFAISRSKRFLSGLLSGYGSIAANIVFTMTSIPLALHYLDKEQFGLWALAAQINGYLILMDIGMHGAVSRFIADHKDEVNGGEFGSQLLTGALVFSIQGLLIAFFGMGFSWFAPSIFAIPDNLIGEFRNLLMLLAGFTGFSVASRSIGSPLWAFHRNDVINNLSTIGLLTNLFLLWLGFINQWGTLSFVIAQIPGLVLHPVLSAWVCYRKHYYPSKGHWGKISLAILKQNFSFGKDLLMINLGSQLINATQVMIIARCISLEAAATFAVSTKIYTMSMMLIANPVSVAGSGLTELYVRGEHTHFVRRYKDIIVLTLAVSTLAAIGIAAGNRAFVNLWTHGSIHWHWTGDLMLAILIVLRNFNGCFLNLFGLVKNWRPVRYVYILEGIIFVPLGIIFAKLYGIAGILMASLIAHLFATTTLSARAAGQIIGSPLWIGKGITISLVMIAVASTLNWTGIQISAGSIPMLGTTACLCLLGSSLIWRLILPESLKSEVRTRLAR